MNRCIVSVKTVLHNYTVELSSVIFNSMHHRNDNMLYNNGMIQGRYKHLGIPFRNLLERLLGSGLGTPERHSHPVGTIHGQYSLLTRLRVYCTTNYL